MSYFVTGATGFIGRYLVHELLDNREGEIHLLCREGSRGRLDALIAQKWGGSSRLVPVVGDLRADQLGVDPAWIDEHRGTIDHFFHLAAIYDMTASEELNETLNVGGTRSALSLAGALEAGVFHQVSSVAASGDYRGLFDESMFDEGQGLPSAYHRTKFESEKIVREESPVPWRVYRPAVVVGHSETGEMDKIDGPYYFFPLFKRMRDTLPSWLPLVGVDLGDTNVVPVDYVAKAMDHLAHLPDHDGEAFHLVNPEPQNTVELVNTFAAAAKAPQFATPIDRSVTNRLPTALLPRQLRPGALLGAALRTPPAHLALGQTLGRLGIPPEVLDHVSFPSVYASEPHPEGAGRLRHRGPRPRVVRRAPCGPTGRRCSTTRSSTTRPRSPRSRARRSSSPAPRPASAWSPPCRSPRPERSRSWWPAARTSSRPPRR